MKAFILLSLFVSSIYGVVGCIIREKTGYEQQGTLVRVDTKTSWVNGRQYPAYVLYWLTVEDNDTVKTWRFLPPPPLGTSGHLISYR